MQQTLDEQRVELDKQAKGRRRRDGAGEFLAQAVAHVPALEPGLNVARRLVGAALVGAAMRTRRLPLLGFLCVRLGRLATLAHLRQGLDRAAVDVVPLAMQDGLDDTVHQQVRIAPDGAREVRVGVVGQTEVT